VRIRGFENLDGINTGYTSLNPPAEWETGRHGGDRGSDFPDISFGPGEVVTRVSIKSATDDGHVKEVFFKTTQQEANQPRSGQGDKVVDWNCDVGRECFVGFAGQTDEVVNGMQVQFVRFSPVDWDVVPDLFSKG
jgi:hypothetical protein